MGLYRAAAMISQEKQKQSKSRREGGRNTKLKAKQNGSMQNQADEITKEKYKRYWKVILTFKPKPG